MLRLLKKIYNDEGGLVSIEMIFIIVVIVILILIFILKFGWLMIKNFFDEGMEDFGGVWEGVVNGINMFV